MISEYIKETQEFGVSETLISYLSIPIKSEKIKLNKNDSLLKTYIFY